MVRALVRRVHVLASNATLPELAMMLVQMNQSRRTRSHLTREVATRVEEESSSRARASVGDQRRSPLWGRRSSARVVACVLVVACLPRQDLDGYELGDVLPRGVEEPIAPPAALPIDPAVAAAELAPASAPPVDGAAGVEKSGSGESVVLQEGEGNAGPAPAGASDAGADAADVADAGVPADGGGAGEVVVPVDECDGPGEVLGPTGDVCYFFSTEAQSWTGARDDCRRRLGDLGAITSREEDELVGAIVEDALWIGANDRQSEGTFVWDSGEPFVFQRFASGEPDDLLNLQDCVEKREGDGLWVDRACELTRRYVCERAIGATAPGEG